ncbi:hypothetical protein COLO4_32085 [Corchorus olitorius]|uniref:Uncharacterized protein n=1 Tax=Corchorus olitorius TaxID=93759 RepID=A0A1R3H216_9ROSI|nr:hypothetical protein COLO4_32085 [Corchorus olitorius]
MSLWFGLFKKVSSAFVGQGKEERRRLSVLGVGSWWSTIEVRVAALGLAGVELFQVLGRVLVEVASDEACRRRWFERVGGEVEILERRRIEKVRMKRKGKARREVRIAKTTLFGVGYGL